MASTSAFRAVSFHPPTWFAHQARLVPQPSNVWCRADGSTLHSVLPATAVVRPPGGAGPPPLERLVPRRRVALAQRRPPPRGDRGAGPRRAAGAAGRPSVAAEPARARGGILRPGAAGRVGARLRR